VDAEEAWMLTVLYVEDHPVNMTLMERALARRGGVQLTTATSGREAVRLADWRAPTWCCWTCISPTCPAT
jgi:CheY-like chemotaxis protein